MISISRTSCDEASGHGAALVWLLRSWWLMCSTPTPTHASSPTFCSMKRAAKAPGMAMSSATHAADPATQGTAREDSGTWFIPLTHDVTEGSICARHAAGSPGPSLMMGRLSMLMSWAEAKS